VKQTLFKGKKDGKYGDMEKEHKVLQKLMQEYLLPKGGGVDQLSLEHKVFLHYIISFEKVNFPRYIFHHKLWALEKSQQKDKTFVPYGRLLSEIFHQEGMLKILKLSRVVNDNQIGTMVGKYINGSTPFNMHLVQEVDKRDIDFQESWILSIMMDDCPPISKEYPLEVRAHYVFEHWKATGETIKYDDILDTMYGGCQLITSKKRKSKKKTTSEAADEEEASEPKPKKVKKERGETQAQEVVSTMPTIQEEVEDLEPVKIIEQ